MLAGYIESEKPASCIERQERRIVIKLKYAQNDTNDGKRLTEAVEQIEIRDYSNTQPQIGLLGIAAVISSSHKLVP